MGKVLVTGGNGFVATHIVHQLLKNGHIVVATVRAKAKGEDIKASIPASLSSTVSNLSTAIVPDVTDVKTLAALIESEKFDGVIHTASPFHFHSKDPHDYLDPAIKGTTAILEAIKSSGPTVKRVVITSSCAAILDNTKNNDKGYWPGHVYSEADWNPITWEEATSGDPGAAYYGSKTFAEKAAWDFVAKEKPFEIATICPPMIYGPVAHKLADVASLNTSNAGLYSLITGDAKELPVQPVLFYVDVRDVALAHVAAYELPGAANQRFMVAAGTYTNLEAAQILRKHFPAQAGSVPTKVPAGVDPTTGYPQGGYYTADNSKAVKVLGIKFRSFEESLVDLIEGLKASGKI